MKLKLFYVSMVLLDILMKNEREQTNVFSIDDDSFIQIVTDLSNVNIDLTQIMSEMFEKEYNKVFIYNQHFTDEPFITIDNKLAYSGYVRNDFMIVDKDNSICKKLSDLKDKTDLENLKEISEMLNKYVEEYGLC